MSKIIRTQYDNTKCRTCGVAIEYGANVRWTKGIKGVVCMVCPDDATAASTTPTTANNTAEIASLKTSLDIARETFRQQREQITALQAEVASLRSQLATSAEVRLAAVAHAARLHDELLALKPAPVEWWAAAWACEHTDPVFRGEHAQSCAVCGVWRYEPGHEPETDTFLGDPASVVDDGNLIDVMAPGGVEAWLAHDLAQIAAEKAAKAAADADDDCPI